ncbi:ATP-binding protein [Hyalangium versicolor]|uniref:ATP-binding protein n=1 Tax=Hyalangium versicolor TaxID=2861190 RepID=UPI001CC9557A|nr:ATP-binding protein [Hyalangium versicolor]
MKTTVLIADDDATSRRMLEATLERHGYATLSVSDGEQAWQVLQRPVSPAIAVLDWNMPGMDGPEICRRVRQLQGRPYVFLILITARSEVGATVAGREAGADDFILKPFYPPDLLARIHVGERIIAAERRLAAQLQRQSVLHAVAQAMAESRDLGKAIRYILQLLCEEFRWEYAGFWRVEAEEGVLRAVETYTPTPASPGLTEFEALSRTVALQPGQGLPGLIWSSGRPEWRAQAPGEDEDIGPRQSASRQAGLSSACGVPLMGERELLGVLELIGRTPRPLDEELLQLLAHIGRELAHFIQRSRVEEALRISEARTRAVIEHMPTGLIIISPFGRIETMNGAAEQIFGYSREECLGKPFSMLVVEEAGNRGRLMEQDKRLEPGRIWEWEGRRKNGEVFPFELALYELPVAHGYWFAAKIHDISERRELDRLKNEFVSTVSHELRTPLTAILGSLSLLQGGVVGHIDPQARELIQIAHANVERLIRLVNDILDIEKIEAGGLELKLGVVDPKDIVATTVDGIRGMAQVAGVELVSDVGDSHKVYGDFDRLVQVLTNLVSNAIKFSPARGSVFVRTMPQPGMRVRFSVVDQGRGIAPEQQHKLFGKFQQLDSSDTRSKGGTGLGLAISKAIVELHRGRIGVESQVGQGATFWFELPSLEDPGALASG